jgi:hypothetical protein
LPPEAQIMLQRIGWFDPRKAPFVFEDTCIEPGGSIERLRQNDESMAERHPILAARPESLPKHPNPNFFGYWQPPVF